MAVGQERGAKGGRSKGGRLKVVGVKGQRLRVLKVKGHRFDRDR